MNNIFKTHQKSIYFKNTFQLRSENENWASPIDFPTVFEAYGKGIKSGNWQSCTGINTPKYVIEKYFENNKESLNSLWDCCFELENISWADVKKDKDKVLKLINAANNELFKLPKL